MWSEIRFAARSCRMNPALSAAVIITFALVLSAVGLTWGTFDAVVLRAVPGRHPDRVATLTFTSPLAPTFRGRLSLADVASVKTRSHTLQHVAGYARGPNATLAGNRKVQVAQTPVTEGFFETFGVTTQQGRWFTERDAATGAIVISDAVWRRAFDDDAGVVGRLVEIDGRAAVVVGIAPPDFNLPDSVDQVWTFRALTSDGSLATTRDQFAIGLPRDGLTVRDVAVELNALLTRGGDFDVADGAVFTVNPLRDLIVGQAGRAVVILGGAVALLLLVACVNVMTLLVAREIGRQRDTAIRRALGASRFRIFREVSWHVLLLSLAGSVVGLGAAWWEAGLVRALAPQSIAGIQHTHVDMTAAAIVVTTALLTALGVAWRPAARAWAASDGVMLREGAFMTQGGAGLFRGNRGQGILMAAQIALVVSLATGAGLLARSMVKLLAIDVGFEPRGLESYAFETRGDIEETTALADLMASVRALPGVTSVSLSTLPPFLGLTVGTSFDVETRDGWKPAPNIAIQDISAGYFETMRIPMLQGRVMSDTLRRSDPCEVIVNDAFARATWRDESPLQRRIDLDQAAGEPLPPPVNLHPVTQTTVMPRPDNRRFCTVVGVVGSIREKSLTEPAQERVYFSCNQERVAVNATLIVRTLGKPLNHADTIAATIRRLRPSQSIGFPMARSVDDDMRRSVAQPAFYAWLFGALAATAVMLAVAGVFGMTWHAVVARTREIGIRVALGIGGAAISTRYLTSLLHEVTPLDPLTFIVAPALVTLAALVAVVIPAMRARSVDSTVLMRAQ